MAEILVIDDEMGKVFKLILGLANLEAEIATTGAEGLRLSTTQTHRLVLLDFHLPDMTGPQVLMALRAAGVATPVVITSGSGLLAECGADAYLQKPFRKESLMDVVRAFIPSRVA